MPLDQDETFSYRGWTLNAYFIQWENMWYCDANYPGFGGRLLQKKGRKRSPVVAEMKAQIDRETPQE